MRRIRNTLSQHPFATSFRNILAVLIAVPDMNGVQWPPGWRIHQLSGDRSGTRTISVSGNWRITFDLEDEEIYNLNLAD